ncbi:fibrillin-2-like [Branchiostoma floridae]|uniref:chitinase n=1 Tax=Branchiostoma floridae TaxID=7739 RepID=A0A9J7LWI7_BRAFL|nr:fibrillin-2-like [Branchiostoma floridae]
MRTLLLVSTVYTLLVPTFGYVINSCDVVTTASTDDNYRYRWNLPAIPGSPFTFKVKAQSDVHIALSPINQDSDPMYEIVIGGWRNQWSAIRRRKQGTNWAEVRTEGIMWSPTPEYKSFWISWSSAGTISVGKFGETDSFMRWTDPDPVSISYVGYSTGYGYSGSWKFCDYNECSRNTDDCQHNCVNTLGSYRCTCWNGYRLSGSKSCVDIDECSRNTDGCQHNCVNTYGSYRCTCRNGYQLSGSRYCREINECASNPCRNGGACRDLTNSYRCDCRPGWRGTNCQLDNNECSNNNGGCEHNCVNTYGSYQCTCRDGYQIIGSRYCTEHDECDSNPCHNNGICRDLTNGFRCDCRPGWTGFNCQTDIDECSANAGHGPCDPNNGICHNSPGSYRCWCENGFELLNDLHSCEDVHGCLENAGRGLCDHICTDLIGDVRCSCRAGYQLGTDGYSCDVVCPRGHYKASDDTCVKCDYREYQDEEGQSSCKSCPAGTNAVFRGATNIAECAAQCVGGHAPCTDCHLIGGNVDCECADGWAGSSDGLVCGRDDDMDGFSDVPISCGNGECTVDNCPGVPNADQPDMDSDGKGDDCDEDIDGDGVLNDQDNCPQNPNPDQTNTNGTPAGNACETSLNDVIATICENQPDGTYLPHPNGCSMYVRCYHAGNDAVYPCAPSTHWSQELLTCVRSDLANCN